MEAELGLEVTQLLVVVLGLVTSLIMAGLKLGTNWFRKLPKKVQATVVAGLAVPIALLGGAMGVDLPGDPTSWDGNTVNVILTWLTAMGVHAGGDAIAKK